LEGKGLWLEAKRVGFKGLGLEHRVTNLGFGSSVTGVGFKAEGPATSAIL